VNILIHVFSAVQKEEYTSFNQLCDKGHKIQYKKWCPVEEREVPWSEIKKGYDPEGFLHPLYLQSPQPFLVTI
jgi:DNA end-binding protein Ku